MKIYYLIPDLYVKKVFSFRGLLRSILDKKILKYIRNCFFLKPKPVGGIKVIYQHCILLRELGYEAIPVLMGRYKGNFFGYEIDCKKIDDVIDNITTSDVVVATEFEPYQGLKFNNAKKIIFVQNWLGLNTRLNEVDKGKNYLEIGYDYVITCSNYCTDYVQAKMDIPATTVTNGIDLSRFYPINEKRIPKRILAMSRKNSNDLTQIMRLMKNSVFEFKVVDSLSQEDLIQEYQSADIFLATGYPEGFGLPPLEAMACGCVVVGFTGGGANEFMHDNKTALIADDGDIETVVKKLKLLENDTTLLEAIRQRGLANAQNYSLAVTQKHLESFFNNIQE